MTYKIHVGNNLDILPTLPDNSVDSIVTDPPYELGFMGKKWDSTGIAYSVELWEQCLRVLKPGGHLLAFSASRTYHRQVVAIEDAGFEIRDMISWISNKTFPKSLNISKAIDKAAGAERQVIGTRKQRANSDSSEVKFNASIGEVESITVPATEDAKKWDGWGTALKPTVEPIVMARKPLEGTVANNVLTYGTGGINIDGSRIGTELITTTNGKGFAGSFEGGVNTNGGNTHEGRWPANVILDEDAAEIVDEQSESKASRFFYVAKASKRDRNEGLEMLEDSISGSFAGNVSNTGNKIGANPDRPNQPAKNYHPTVKPTTLMSYLIKLVTPLGGTVLDPFTGSGSTGKAAILDGFDFVGIEMTEDYIPIIEGRLAFAEKMFSEKKNTETEKLF